MKSVCHAMPFRLPRLLAPCALAALLGACSLSPRIDRDFGSSLHQAQAQQTLNPGAKHNQSPVNGLDAQAAKAAYDNYQKSFAQPEAQSNGFTLGTK